MKIDRELQILRNIFHKPQLIVEFKLGEYLFSDDINEKIFLDVLKRFKSNKPISFDDFLSLKTYPQGKKKRLEEIRQIEYKDNTNALQSDIQDEKIRSKFMQSIENVSTRVSCGEPIRDIISEHQRYLSEIQSYLSNSKSHSLEDIVNKWMNDKINLEPIPFKSLEFVETSGSQFMGICAPPRTGKTLLMQEIAFNYPKSKNILIISLEMKAEELISRKIASISGIDSNRTRRGMNGKEKFSPTEIEKIEKAVAKIASHSNIKIIDDVQNIDDIEAVIKKENYIQKLDFVFIDHFHLITGGYGGLAENERLAGYSMRLKSLSKFENIDIFALLQPNREHSRRDNKKPTISDIRGSGSLEQDLDVIMLLYRDYLYNDSADKDKIEVIVAKNKFGDSRPVTMGVNLETQKIYDLKDTLSEFML